MLIPLFFNLDKIHFLTLNFINNPNSYFLPRYFGKITKKTIIDFIEHYEKITSETAERLELTNNKYFNAGVTFINYERWLSEKYTDNLTNWMNYLGDRVLWFDQDIINSYLNGMYNELPAQLNFTNLNLSKDEAREEAVFYHYWGKKKPWTVKGMLFYKESFYQEFHRKIFENNYHIVHRYKRDSMLHFLKLILSFKIFSLKYPARYMSNFFKSFT